MGIAICLAWLALLVGFVGGAAFVGIRQEGSSLIGRRFVFELLTISGFLSFLLWGLTPMLVGLGFGR